MKTGTDAEGLWPTDLISLERNIAGRKKNVFFIHLFLV